MKAGGFPRLLAKSSNTPDKPLPGESLQGHIAHVVRAAEVLCDARGSLSLQAMGLPTEWAPRLRCILQLAAFMHDLGKCSEHFQEIVRHKPRTQLVRHEAISLWLCWPGQTLASWLRPAVATDDDYDIAVIAAAGHHRKFREHAIAPEGNGAEVKLLCEHRDFMDTLRYGAQLFRLEQPPSLGNIPLRITTKPSLEKLFERWGDDIDDKYLRDEPWTKFLALTKVLLICADVAGSAIPRHQPADTQTNRWDWLAEQLRDEDIGEPLLRLVQKKLGNAEPRPFQTRIAASNAPVTLVKAGCGTGKTIGAYLWAAQQYPTRRLWFTYPTTGTATEGFRDYLHPSELEGKLVHSRADIDLELLGLDEKTTDEESRDTTRLESLRDWGLDAVTCTVDSVLGLVQNNRRGVYAWPNIANGAIVFDEIHAYDDKLFGALLRFLEALPGVPVLLMTASLPAFREHALNEVCQRVHGQSLTQIAGPAEIEQWPRYRGHESMVSSKDALAHIADVRARGGKVLWVSNTVDRAIDAAQRAAAIGKTLLYHSRFRYVDRVERHRDIIDAFHPRTDEFVVACTTQVAEMSLDLSADLLITDLAPIPAMIQRLGRLNRRSSPDKPASVKPFLVLRPNHHLPYEQAQLDEAEVWLQKLGGRDTSQADLVAAWNQPVTRIGRDEASSWLDGGFCTSSAALRDATVGITVLRYEDREAVLRRVNRPLEVAIPMNKPPSGMQWKAWERSRVTGYLPVCPENALEYDPKVGARWVK